MTNEQGAAGVADATPQPRPDAPSSGRARGLSFRWFALIGIVILVDIAAFVVFPQVSKEGTADCPFPACFIQNALEFPAPHTVVDLAPDQPVDPAALVVFHPSISNTIITMWIVMVLVLAAAILMVRGSRLIPRGGQNVIETVYETMRDFGVGIAGPAALPYIPIFVGAFLLILFDNWIGLVPPVGKVEYLRAPSSDVNITIGMALVAFVIFEVEGFRKLGVGGYLGKFFPLYEFRNGIGAGIIALFVGLIELLLEFVKPVTLSMRLFGNIYGGEVALGVLTTLTVLFIPVALIGLELLLNAIQALIFSVLTLIFITLAIESHHEEEGHLAEDALAELHGSEPKELQPAH
ncbi:MAG TPA: FoF1 ATP synthase subunit a [Candidatus Limnocylindrales bacterium]